MTETCKERIYFIGGPEDGDDGHAPDDSVNVVPIEELLRLEKARRQQLLDRLGPILDKVFHGDDELPPSLPNEDQDPNE